MNPYTLHINLYDLALLGAIFIGSAFSFLLGFTRRENQSANNFLALALGVTVAWSVWVLGIDVGLDTYLPHWSFIPLQFSLALGPLIYFYVLKFTRPDYKLGWKSAAHFVPLLLQQCLLVFEVREGIKTNAATYYTPIFHQAIPVLHLLTFVSVIIYLYLSHQLVNNFYQRLKFNGGDRHRYELRWLSHFLTALGLLCLFWILIAAADYFYCNNQLSAHIYYPLYLFLSAVFIRMAVVSFLKQGAQAAISPPFASAILPPSELKQKGIWLKDMMKAKLYYQDPDITLTSLAEKLGLHHHELSRIINVTLNKNFNDFINEYRIREVTRKMRDPAYNRFTLIGIAYDAGFNSKSTFNRVFREMTGKSAAEYKDSLKNVRPTYHLSLQTDNAAIISGHKVTLKWLWHKLTRSFMFKNYFKIAWRNLWRQKLYSLINISGLATGLAVCMLIMLYVTHEHSYDRFHKNADRIVKPYAKMRINGNTFQTGYSDGGGIKASQPLVEDYVRTLQYRSSAVVVSKPAQPDKKFAENKLLIAEAGFFNFFSFKLLSGQPSQVLANPFSVVLSQDMAKKYFGDENPIGQTLIIKTDSAYTYQVTGVAENCPSNSSIEYNFITSASGLANTKQGKELDRMFDVYLLLKHPHDTASLRRSLLQSANAQPDGNRTTIRILALVDKHLGDARGDDNKYLTIFPLIALLILLLALVNYMSLSTARATLRAKEVGVRKVAGASRKSVALQFYIESAVFSTISFVLGYILCCLFKPVFFNVLQLKIENTFLYSPLILLLLLGLLLVTILVSGSYPALLLSAFKPVVTLKGKMGKQAGGVIIRKIFTTLQFSISIALIICGIVIDRQLYFFRHAETGVDRDNIVMIPVGSTFKNYPAFNHDIRTLAGISNVATSRYGMFTYRDMIGVEGKTKAESTMLTSLTVNPDFFELVGLRWKYPPVSYNHLTTGNKVVINELAIEKLNLPRNPVGSYINTGKNIEVAGVVKNFNFMSLEDPMEALGLFVVPDTAKFWKTGCNLFAKIKPHTNLPTLLGKMQTLFKKYDTDTPFDYTFMDDAFNANYKAEDRLASIFSIFTIITIVLAAMGLFGLAAFTIEQRTKEIGIRKVLGASVSAINSLLSKDFLKLVVLSVVIASPVAWYFMHQWLQGFAYRINIQWWMFAGAGLLAVVIAVVTVSYHAVRAAVANPVDSLRSE